MTAIASVPNLQSLPRSTWTNGNGSQTSVNGGILDDGSRMLVPRKSAQRTNSSSSTSSAASANSTLSSAAFQVNGAQNGDATWTTRKKPTKAAWSAAKDTVSGMITARPQLGQTNGAGPPAVSAMMHPQNQSQVLQQQPGGQSQWPQNGVSRSQGQSETPAILHLLPINGTFEAKTITVPFSPDVLRIGRQTNQKTVPTPLNGYFDSKVLSRQHAEIWAERDGKIWIRDVKSSNGTFVNGKRLSLENRDSEPHPLKEQDVLELGIDIVSEDQKTVVHHKVAARIEHAGIYGIDNAGVALTFSDLDSSAVAGVMGQVGLLNGRTRSGSQGSNGSNGRFGGPGSAGGVNNMVMAAYHAKWLQPISMEQIVKRINAELKQARSQSSDLRHTTNFLEAVAADEKLLIQAPQKPLSQDIPNNARAQRTSPPSAPPPTQPLPEAPWDGGLRSKLNGLPALQPLLRRTDTERPKVATPNSGRNSPTKAGPTLQVRSLVEALTTAQKEISTQGEKLKEVEEALRREREDRKSAEERAVRLESGSPSVSRLSEAPVHREGTAELDASKLQSLLDVMRAEMDEMKMHMEKYRQRAETAEENSRHDRKSLAEMVESIQKRNEAVKRRKERRRAGNGNDRLAEKVHHQSESDEDDIEEISLVLDDEVERAVSRLNGDLHHPLKHGLNGTAGLPSVHHLQEIGKAAVTSLLSSAHSTTAQFPSQTSDSEQKDADKEASSSTSAPEHGVIPHQRNRTQEHLVQSAPYASLIGVVLLGVGMMAYLNGWQRVVER